MQKATSGAHHSRLAAARGCLMDSTAQALLRRVSDAFCDPTRAQMVRAMQAGPLTVTEVSLAVGRSKSATSRHLRVLRIGGFVLTRRRGRHVYYRLDEGPQVQSATRALDVVVAASAT